MKFELKSKEELPHGIRRIARKQVDQITQSIAERRPECQGVAIHEARKSVKKSRAVLRLVRVRIGKKVYRKENRAFRETGRTMSSRRDAEVLLKTLGNLRKHSRSHELNSTLDRLQKVFQERFDRAFRAGNGQKRNGKTDLVSEQKHIKDWPLGHLKWSDLGCGIERTYQQGRERMENAARSHSMQALHDWRKRVKDLWYELRLLKPIKPKAMSRLATDAKRLSQLLGDDHDLAALEQEARKSGLNPRDIKLISELIQTRRPKLQKAAFKLGQLVYREQPADFARRIKSYGKAWKRQ
ncbi:MAG: hypothetical protein JWR26_3383 [Pedosphaera sp.]|nr:hypothetical protein [Pedosphaera sp.]